MCPRRNTANRRFAAEIQAALFPAQAPVIVRRRLYVISDNHALPDCTNFGSRHTLGGITPALPDESQQLRHFLIRQAPGKSRHAEI